MAHDQHVPQDELTPQQRSTIVAAVRAVGAEPWTALLARALTVREDWDHACAELEESDASPGPNDGPWNAWHILNHVGGFTTLAARHLLDLSDGKPIDFSVAGQWQGDDASFAQLRSGVIQGWDTLITAITRASMTSPADATFRHPLGEDFTTRELVALVLRHAQIHAAQMRDVRGLAPGDNPGDAAGDLGRRRQTAH